MIMVTITTLDSERDMDMSDKFNHPVLLGLGATVVFSLFILLLMGFGNLLS